jgi:hypothetical protein
MSLSRIVAGPRWGFSRPADYRLVRARLLAEARRSHQAELDAASFRGRLVLELALRQKVRAKLRGMFPSDALYAFGDTR